jgi:hypothetical protein
MNRGLLVDDQNSRQTLARRLRALREESWPARKVNQDQLAKALSADGRRSVSVPLISSWESRTNPTVPPVSRIEDIATFFASPRSFDGHVGQLLAFDEMTVHERAARDKLVQELTQLRTEALHVAGASWPRATITSPTEEIAQSLNSGPYRIEPGDRITIVCAQLPPDMLQQMPYADPLNPDYIELYRYSDLDSLLELFGHLRATNPTSRVEFQAPDRLSEDDYTGHLVSLGGVDWNDATGSVLDRLQLPVRQVSRLDENEPGDAYFEVTDEDGHSVIHRPRLDESRGRKILREDITLFARAISPYNQRRFVTICNGMYGRGTYGAVRALTDERFRDRNAKYLRETFGDSDAFCILTRVTVVNGRALTPDWTLPETRLFEWSSSQ